MYKAVVRYLCCPRCRKDLSLQICSEQDDDVLEGRLSCETGHEYRIYQGVADFGSAEQSFANQWEVMGENQSFDEIEREMDEKNPVEVIRRRELVMKDIVGAVSAQNHGIVLDIASGRGLLLTKLVNALPDDVHIISVDLSAYVLQYDHRKFKQKAPGKKISYLACDATNLPLKECTADAATTYCGFSNMLGCASEALREAHRVMKPGAVLADSFVVIKQASQGYQILQQVCREQHIEGAEAFFLHDGLMQHHSRLFSKVKHCVAFEGTGVENDMDLLPYPGEWYAEHVYVSEK